VGNVGEAKASEVLEELRLRIGTFLELAVELGKDSFVPDCRTVRLLHSQRMNLMGGREPLSLGKIAPFEAPPTPALSPPIIKALPEAGADRSVVEHCLSPGSSEFGEGGLSGLRWAGF
jgi:hypothetical protein